MDYKQDKSHVGLHSFSAILLLHSYSTDDLVVTLIRDQINAPSAAAAVSVRQGEQWLISVQL